MSGRLSVTGEFFCDYELILPASEIQNEKNELFILLHGYEQNKDYMLKKVAPWLPQHAHVLIPNAPFPLPKRENDHFTLNFAWYFFDTLKQQYFYAHKQAANYLKQVIQQLKLLHLPATIIGFSQGGYLAPFLGLEIKSCQRIISLNAELREFLLPERLAFNLDCVCGKDDTIVNPYMAKSAHDKLIQRGNHGTFYLVDGAGHGLGANMQAALAKIINS